MPIARGALLPLLFSLLSLVRLGRSVAAADVYNGSSLSSSLSSAFRDLNITVGGKLRLAVPFEKDCFSIVEGQNVGASPAVCADLQANYTNPLYRVTHFSAYMNVCVPSRACSAHGWLLIYALPADTMGNMPSFERN